MLTEVEQFKVGDITVGGREPLFLIAGLCVIESEEHTRRIARELKAICREAGMPLVFKASYDKANRTSLDSYRGPGLRDGLKILGKIRKDFQLPLLVDFHREEDAAAAAEVADILQVPAFLCRQTDLLLAAGRTGRAVNVKKGQFLAPEDIRHIIGKLKSTGNRRIMFTERGVSFGYHSLVNDIKALPIMRGFGFPVVFDATHSVQSPGGQGDTCHVGMIKAGETSLRGDQDNPCKADKKSKITPGRDGLFEKDGREKDQYDGPDHVKGLSHLSGQTRIGFEKDQVVSERHEEAEEGRV